MSLHGLGFKLCLYFNYYLSFHNSGKIIRTCCTFYKEPKMELLPTAKRPSIIVFDLDRTLWPFQVDKDTSNPFRRRCNKVLDANDKIVETFPGVLQLLQFLISESYTLAVASRIEDIVGAYQLLQLFELNSLFSYKEIYPTSKVVHFRELKRKSGVEFSNMIFFDDDERNMKSVGRLGVVTYLVPETGVTYDFVMKSLNLFCNREASF